MNFEKLFIFFFIVLFIVVGIRNPTITGMATRTEEIELKIVELANVTPFLAVTEDADLCVKVEEGEIYSYHLTKTDITTDCTGNEDFIIKYLSYDDLVRSVNMPTCVNFMEGATGRLYYFLPSRFVHLGGVVTCNADFERKYCAIAKACLKESEMEFMGLDCCANYEFSANQTALLQEYIQETGSREAYRRKDLFNESIAGIMVPLNLKSGLGMVLSAIVVVVLLVFVFKKAHLAQKENKPYVKQLHDYVTYTEQLGYTKEQIKQVLLGVGWNQKDVDLVLR